MIHMAIDGSNEQIRRVIYIAALQNTQFMAAPKINSRPFYLDPGHRTNDKYSKHESATNWMREVEKKTWLNIRCLMK